MACILCLFPDTPPNSNEARKGSSMAQQSDLILARVNNANTFQVDLKDAPCVDPLACVANCVCSAYGCTACYWRKRVLEQYGNGIQDFVCFQGYMPKVCCVPTEGCFPGSPIGICLEGFCCTVFSLSITRIMVMDRKNIKPNGTDYQIIHFANCLGCLACVCMCAARAHRFLALRGTVPSTSVVVVTISRLSAPAGSRR